MFNWFLHRRPVRRSHHGAEPAHGHPLRVRAGRGHEARGQHAVPGRRGDRQEGHRERGQPGQGQVEQFHVEI